MGFTFCSLKLLKKKDVLTVNERVANFAGFYFLKTHGKEPIAKRFFAMGKYFYINLDLPM